MKCDLAVVQGCFQLKPDRSAFQLAQVPIKQEILDEAMARTKPCSCCQPGAEHAPEELPGPPANPPKQPRSRGRPECQSHDSGSQPSGRAGAGTSITAASSAPDLAQEVSTIFDPLLASHCLLNRIHEHEPSSESIKLACSGQVMTGGLAGLPGRDEVFDNLHIQGIA